ncbi:3'-5' exonuclease [Vibrio owensii]|nr:3'-5' exonuclease [Vibrio owensii]
MPTVDMYPHAEERRSFYVAITRSKKRCYLVADPKEPSEFVLELLSP